MKIKSIAPARSSAKCPRFNQLSRFNWKRYRARLLGLFRKKMGAKRRRYYDEEDLVQVTLANYFYGVANGQIDSWQERDPWPLLAVIARRKMIDFHHYENRRKRGGGRVESESALKSNNGDATDAGLSQWGVDSSSPASRVDWEEQFELLLSKLNDPMLRCVAKYKLDGHTNQEIASLLQCSRATVARKLSAIRNIWQNDFVEELAEGPYSYGNGSCRAHY